jgi:hypothetical protein
MQKTLEFDGGTLELDADGVIRYRDNDGNCENIWRKSDADYAYWRSKFD